MKKKILFVVNIDWFFISHRLPLAIEAMNKGYEVHLACNFSASKSYLENKGIICHNIPFTRSNYNPLNTFALFRKNYMLYKKVKPDLLHLVTIKPILLGGIASRILKIPSTVFAISGLGYIFISKGLLASMRRKFISLIYSFVFNSKNFRVIFQNIDDLNELTHLTELNKIHSVIIPGAGVNVKDFSFTDLPSSPPIVMMASRLLKDKGVYEFIEAARIVKQKNKKVRFVLVGTPDPENPSSISFNEINKWIKLNYVEYWGQKEDMQYTISQSTIVVLPSYREGLPKILIEAASCGRPVITTNVPGCRDAILEMKTGLLVEKYNEKDLADEILYLTGNIMRCKEMGKAGRRLVEKKFSEKLIVEQHMDVYERLLTKIQKT